jgi:hypothetical protein
MPPPNSREHILRLHTNQKLVFDCPARFRVLVAGRRFGKTHLALTEMLHAAQVKGRNIWYVGPSYRQAKRIAWDRLKQISRPFWDGLPSETDLSIRLTFGSTLAIRGADRPDSLRGDGLDLVILDEFASMRPEAWTEVLRPALADRLGSAFFVGTPDGRNHLYEHYEYANTKNDPDWAAFHFTTAQGGLVHPDELHAAARQLDLDCYRQEFEAEFTGAGRNRVYYGFDRITHVQKVDFEILHPIVWAIDFNVNPMCMLLMQRFGDNVYVFDEIVIKPEANTELACETFFQRTKSYILNNARPVSVEVYGDASGNQRRTSGSSTDWTIIRQFFARTMPHYHATFHSNTANPAVRDRVNCVNSRLLSAVGEARIFIDPRCHELISDLEQVTWALDSSGQVSSEINKSDPARTHASDALGYFVSQAYSLRPKIGHQSAGPLPLF